MNCKKQNKILLTAFILIIFLVFNSAVTLAYEKEIKNLSSSLAERIAKAGRKSIAVVDFTDLQGNVTELGRFFAEEFSVELAGADKGFEVVERTQLKSILKEHKLAVSDIIDPSTARKLGQIAGVDALITGTITPFGESVRLSAKILDTTTAKVIGATSGDIPKTKAIEELLAKSIDAPVSQESGTVQSLPPASGKPVKFSDVNFRPLKCSLNNSKVICIIAFENLSDKQRNIYLHPNSYVYDNRGNKYPITLIKLGDKESQNGLSDRLIPQLSLNAQFTSAEMPPEVTRVTLFIDFCIDNWNCGGQQNVVIRDIAITK